MALPHYLAEHPGSGKALFTKLPDAQRWLEYQHDYHRQQYDEPQDVREAAETRWVDGGGHGWHTLVSAANARRSFGSVVALVPDWTLPRDDWDDGVDDIEPVELAEVDQLRKRVAELEASAASSRGTFSALRTVVRHGDMSDIARREITNLLDDTPDA